MVDGGAAVSFELDSSYIDVAQRLRDLKDTYPQGSMQQLSLEFREVAGQWWVVYTAACYRTPDDERPGHGTAWEQVPGKTPYTKGSELQNAETAAWGRAIVAALAGGTKRIASREEVRNRGAEQDAEQSLNAAKREVFVAWKSEHGDWDQLAAQVDFEAFSGGQQLSAASAEDLALYARHIKGEQW